MGTPRRVQLRVRIPGDDGVGRGRGEVNSLTVSKKVESIPLKMDDPLEGREDGVSDTSIGERGGHVCN